MDAGLVQCPLCQKQVKESLINQHLDSGCSSHLFDPSTTPNPPKSHSFFSRKSAASNASNAASSSPAAPSATQHPARPKTPPNGTKRSLDEAAHGQQPNNGELPSPSAPKRAKLKALERVMPLAERMRPTSLDHVYGQELVGPTGLLRGMLASDTLPSMVLWGKPGTGKTTIARLIANASDSRFVEISSTSTKLEEVRKIFQEAVNDLRVTGRKTIVFCDEIHRFSKTQQDAFLGPVEAGQITLIAATTENPSFKVINALLSRCRTFTLDDLKEDHLIEILGRAKENEGCTSPLIDAEMLKYFAQFSDGDARTALNLLDLAMNLCKNPAVTKDDIKKSLTKTLVYDRAGDQHYDTISALHKSIRGSDADAALYYLARMLQSGEDPRYIARRLIVVASEDVGLADNTMLPLAIATHDACEKIGMPECRINLGHAVVALCQAPKSTRAYRGLSAAFDALKEPGIAALPIPHHLRNAPTKLMKEMGYGQGYKYNPDYLDGKVRQEYLPSQISDRTFLDEEDFGTMVDEDLVDDNELRPELED